MIFILTKSGDPFMMEESDNNHAINLFNYYGLNCLQALVCIYMDLKNLSCLISTSGHDWERDGSRQKPEPVDNLINELHEVH